MDHDHNQLLLAVCVRQQTAALAVLDGTNVLEVRRRYLRRLPRGTKRTAFVTSAIFSLANDYGIGHVVLEPGSPVKESVETHGLSTTTLSVDEAKRRLLPRMKPTQEALFNLLLREHPQLANIVTVLRTGRIAMSERGRNVQLLAIALGLAAITDRQTNNFNSP